MAMETSPRTNRFISTDILTSGYRIVGKAMVTNHGVMGMINDNSHSAVEINDARLARLHMPTKRGRMEHFGNSELHLRHGAEFRSEYASVQWLERRIESRQRAGR